MTGWGCVTFDRRKRWRSALGVILGLLWAVCPICVRADESTGCERTESEIQFFQRQEQDTSKEMAPSLQGSPCAAQKDLREAYSQGFQQSYKATHYLPTFGKFEMHPRIMSEITSSQYACDSLQSQKRACCLAGYVEGEASFKKRLKSSREVPIQCQEDFASGRKAASEVCESAKQGKEVCTIPPLFQCHLVCYSFGWNEGILECLPESSLNAPETKVNSRVQFQKAYQAENEKTGKTVIRSEARSAQ